MMRWNVSACGRFVVVDDLHLDRSVFEALVQWAAARDLRLQDALQVAVCALQGWDLGAPKCTALDPRELTSVESRHRP